MPGPKLTIAELPEFCSASSMPLIRKIDWFCVVVCFCLLFFLFVACKGTQLVVLENKILFTVTKQVTACETAVQVSVLTCKEMKEYWTLRCFQFMCTQTRLPSKILSASVNNVILQTNWPPWDRLKFLHVFFQLTEYLCDILQVLNFHFLIWNKRLFFFPTERIFLSQKYYFGAMKY